MRAFRIIYFNHRGPYEKIGTAFANAKSIFSRHFKISKMIGLYYDNPK
jgi:DNA gyrase inhibitor GyrI